MDDFLREEEEYRGYRYVLTSTRLYGYREPKYRFSAVIRKRGEEVYRYPPEDPKTIGRLEDFPSPEEAMDKGRIHIHGWIDLHPSN